MFADFIGVCMDQIVNQMAKFRYMFGGKSRCPAVIRFSSGGGFSAAGQHSQAMYQVMTSFPGLKVVVPSNAYDAKGLMLSAIQDDDPVLFFEIAAEKSDVDVIIADLRSNVYLLSTPEMSRQARAVRSC